MIIYNLLDRYSALIRKRIKCIIERETNFAKMGEAGNASGDESVPARLEEIFLIDTHRTSVGLRLLHD